MPPEYGAIMKEKARVAWILCTAAPVVIEAQLLGHHFVSVKQILSTYTTICSLAHRSSQFLCFLGHPESTTELADV